MPALSRDLILDTAVALADAGGIEGVTLRKIAAELGVHVTSLYHHVPTREAVTEGIIERLLAEADLPLTEVPWEQWVRRFFTAIGDVAEKHPGAFAALQLRPVQGPQALATFEAALAAFAKAGLDAQDAFSAVKATTLMALGAALERTAPVGSELPATDLTSLPAEDFPRVRALDATVDPLASHGFSLEVLVAGLRSQVRSRRT